MEVEYRNSVVREKETVLGDYNKMIEESEKAYLKVIPSIYLIICLVSRKFFQAAQSTRK